ncbi:MAG: hypothetical protein PHE84_03775 [bacterium]|nr:hypothetical protein [bacterium]
MTVYSDPAGAGFVPAGAGLAVWDQEEEGKASKDKIPTSKTIVILENADIFFFGMAVRFF